jgi:hypothetical protein
MAASSATPEPARKVAPSPVLLAVSVAAAPLPLALAVALAPALPELLLGVLVGVMFASLDASVLLAVYKGGGNCVVAGPLTLATSI